MILYRKEMKYTPAGTTSRQKGGKVALVCACRQKARENRLRQISIPQVKARKVCRRKRYSETVLLLQESTFLSIWILSKRKLFLLAIESLWCNVLVVRNKQSILEEEVNL